MASYVNYKGKLKGEFSEIFDKVELYATIHMIEADELEEGMMNLLDTFCQAQEEGKEVSSIIGEDLDQFCKDYFEHPNFIKNNIREFPNMMGRLLLLMCAFSLLELVGGLMNGDSLLQIKSEFGVTIVAFTVASLLGDAASLVVGKYFYQKKHSFAILIGICMVIVVGTITVVSTIEEMFALEAPAVFVVLVTLLGIILCKLPVWGKRLKSHGSIFKTKEEKERSFTSVMKAAAKEGGDSAQADLAKGLLKKYRRITKRKAMSYDEFDEKLRKEDVRIEFVKKAFVVFFIGCMIVPVIMQVAEEGFGGDTVFMAVLGGIYYMVVYRVFAWFVGISQKARKQLYEAAKGQRLTVVEYALKLESEGQKAE